MAAKGKKNAGATNVSLNFLTCAFCSKCYMHEQLGSWIIL